MNTLTSPQLGIMIVEQWHFNRTPWAPGVALIVLKISEIQPNRQPYETREES